MGKKRPRLLIAGGDDRMVELTVIYKGKGFEVTTYGMDLRPINGIKNCGTLEEALKNCDIVIGPVPFSKEVTKLNTKYSGKEILIEELMSSIKSEKMLILGAANSFTKEAAAKHGVKFTDYYNDEGYQIMNTIPTVEGALSLIINETPFTLYKSKVLVLGYGRIGKLLSHYLKMLGAETWVEARKAADLAWIEARGMAAVPLDELSEHIGFMDVIVNTIPAPVLNSELLDTVKKDALIIDLASYPGGLDHSYAKQKGLKAIHALGLPGKVACKSAAEYIYKTISKLMAEQSEFEM